MRIRNLFALLALGAAVSCTHGTRPQTLAVATTPEGAHAYVLVRGEAEHRFGELFAVSDSVVLLRTERLVRIPWARIARLNVDKLDANFDVGLGLEPSSAKLARLARVSRFPQGLDGALLRQVLAMLKQDALEEVP